MVKMESSPFARASASRCLRQTGMARNSGACSRRRKSLYRRERKGKRPKNAKKGIWRCFLCVLALCSFAFFAVKGFNRQWMKRAAGETRAMEWSAGILSERLCGKGENRPTLLVHAETTTL